MVAKGGTVTGYQDKFMSAVISTFDSRLWSTMSNDYGVRPITRAGGWSRIRVGVLASLSGQATVTPEFYLGFCNNDSGNVPGTGTVDHFVGMYSSAAWTYGGSNYNTGTIWNGHQNGGAISTSSGAAGFDISDVASFNHVSPWFVDIVKGTPYTVRCLGNHVVPSGANSYPVSTFHSNMAVNGNLDAVSCPGCSVITTAAFTIDEATDGDLDHICAFWSGLGTAFEIDEVAYSQF